VNLARALVVGGGSVVGRAVAALWRQRGFEVFETSRTPIAGVPRLALDEPEEAWPPLPAVEVALLCAAETSLARCRQAPAATARVNVAAPLALARRLAWQGAFVVFLSTSLVFDGRRPRPGPADAPRPGCEYGRQKAEAERELLRAGLGAAILRMTKILSPELALLRSWAAALRARRPIAPFSDYGLSPLALSDVSGAVCSLADRRTAGLHHLSGDEDLTWAEVAFRLARGLGIDAGLVRPQPAPASDLECVPRYGSLECSATLALLGIPAPSSRTAVDSVRAELERTANL
jgi:dTDP-4-dehydrorhamnose reductase